MKNSSEETTPARDRAVETRDAQQRPATWTPPIQLPTPPNTSEVVYRWIRTATLGVPDLRNVSRRYREGWEPVPSREFPDFMLTPDQSSSYPDNLEIGGLLLCRASAAVMAKRRAYYERMTKNQIESVDHSMFKQMDPRVPMFRQRQSRVIFGSRRPAAAEKGD
jgi:hypothetical protein